jgi:flagellar biosynthesis/type III secretory pathway protein FliH
MNRSGRTEALALFAEDFDLPGQAAPEPDQPPVEPVFDPAQMDAARVVAFDNGYAAGRAAVMAEDDAGLRSAAGQLAAGLQASAEAAQRFGEQAAESIAKLLMASLRRALPALCAAHGEAEVRAATNLVLSGLSREPNIVIRVNPRMVPVLQAEIDGMDPDLADRVHFLPTDAMAVGDLRITWKDGLAVRDSSTIWREIAALLAPHGLLPDDLPPAEAPARATHQLTKETAYGD